MIIRALDVNGDWTYGSGFNNYLSGNKAVALNIQTRLSAFLGDCFFDTASGINWFYFLGSKDQIGLNLAVSATITNTPNVTGILQLSVSIDVQRKITIIYNVITSFSTLSGQFEYDIAS